MQHLLLLSSNSERETDTMVKPKVFMALPVAVMAIMFGGVASATTLQTISAKALTDHECNSEVWGFVINQIDTQSDAPASIMVTWPDATEVVELEAFTGGVAHYLTSDNLTEAVTSASTDIYSGWSGQFNLSHGPCVETSPTPTPTPTVTPTDTPTPTPTVTATPTPTPSVTITPQPTQTPTPSRQATLLPSPTVSPSPKPTDPAKVVPVAKPATLPFTGQPVMGLALAGAGLVGAGSLILMSARRKRI